MARLSEKKLKSISFYPFQFGSSLKTQNFVANNFYKMFEDRAEELDQKYPGQGYQLAYNEALTNAFGGIVTKHLRGDKSLDILSFKDLITYFDDELMSHYFNARKEEGLADEIKMGMDALDAEMLETFDLILNHATIPNVMRDATEAFESGKITLDSAYAHVQSIKNTRPSREEARKLAAYAEYLENKNQDRSILRMLFSLPTHFKELRAIEEMRELAKKEAPISVLLDEATNGSQKLQELINDFAAVKVKEIFTEEDEQEINEISIDDKEENYLGEREISGISANLEIVSEENVIELDNGGNLLDQTLFLDDAFEETDALENDPKISFGDQSVIEDEAFLPDEDDKRLAISIEDLLNDPEDMNDSMDAEALDEAKTTADKCNEFKKSDDFREQIISNIINMIEKPSYTNQDKHDWAEFYIFDDMMKESEKLCELYDEAIENQNSSAKIERIIQNGVNKLYEVAYCGLGGIEAYDSCSAFALEERPVIAQKLTDLFLSKATPVGFHSKEFGKYAENYVIKNSDHAIKVMQEQEQNLSKEKCTELVKNAVKVLHAFEKVEFNKAEFESVPKNTEVAKAHVNEPVKEKSVTK